MVTKCQLFFFAFEVNTKNKWTFFVKNGILHWSFHWLWNLWHKSNLNSKDNKSKIMDQIIFLPCKSCEKCSSAERNVFYLLFLWATTRNRVEWASFFFFSTHKWFSVNWSSVVQCKKWFDWQRYIVQFQRWIHTALAIPSQGLIWIQNENMRNTTSRNKTIHTMNKAKW